jgi:hypothetical protein
MKRWKGPRPTPSVWNGECVVLPDDPSFVFVLLDTFALWRGGRLPGEVVGCIGSGWQFLETLGESFLDRFPGSLPLPRLVLGSAV